MVDLPLNSDNDLITVLDEPLSGVCFPCKDPVAHLDHIALALVGLVVDFIGQLCFSLVLHERLLFCDDRADKAVLLHDRLNQLVDVASLEHHFKWVSFVTDRVTQSCSNLLQLLKLVVQLVVALLDDFGLEVELVRLVAVLEAGRDKAREDVVRLSDHVIVEFVVPVHLVESLVRNHSDSFEIEITFDMGRFGHV